MDRRSALQGLTALAACMALQSQAQTTTTDTASTVFELRIYHCNEGKLPALLSRFRDHTVGIFTRHGITSVGYWTPTDDGPLKDRTLFYMLKYPSREEATIRWKAFQTDPEWVKVRTASEIDGKLVEHVDSTFLALTDFSPKV
jgi:S-ribosylhomocysteine lyase LuxS involved in autoinducer biosynthesis